MGDPGSLRGGGKAPGITNKVILFISVVIAVIAIIADVIAVIAVIAVTASINVSVISIVIAFLSVIIIVIAFLSIITVVITITSLWLQLFKPEGSSKQTQLKTFSELRSTRSVNLPGLSRKHPGKEIIFSCQDILVSPLG